MDAQWGLPALLPVAGPSYEWIDQLSGIAVMAFNQSASA
jgi:hypothetical protein